MRFRRDYRTVGPPPPADPARRAAWSNALGSFESGRLGELATALEKLTAEAPDDGSGWFYLGLARAWLGDNAKALEALDRHLDHEPDDERATVTAALQEVLRCGLGLEDAGDYREHVFLHQFRDPKGIDALLQDWARSRRLVPMQQNEKEGQFVGLLLEMSETGLITAGSPGADAGRFAGYLLITGNVVRVTSSAQGAVRPRLKDEVRQRLGLGLTELKEGRGPIQFPDVVAEALIFPLAGDEKASAERVKKHVEQYYEDTWTHKSRKVLAGNTPIDAAGHTVLRRKLLGVIRFLEDCAKGGMISAYDFGRLRRKLGLTGDGTTSALAQAGAGIAAATADISAMSAAELSGLTLESLAPAQLEQAWQAAQKLDASEIALRFAKAFAASPADPARPDRYPLFTFLTQRALQDGDTTGALDWVNEERKPTASKMRRPATQRLRIAPRSGACQTRRSRRGPRRLPATDRSSAGRDAFPHRSCRGNAVAPSGKASLRVCRGWPRGSSQERTTAIQPVIFRNWSPRPVNLTRLR